MVHPNKYQTGQLIRVFCPTSNGCIVDPGSVQVGTAAIDVEWRNETQDEIEVFVLSRHLGRPKPITINPSDTGRIKVHPKVPTGRFTYAIYCHQTNSFAVGGSEPEMIVP
ncbi:MAG: hypothetical protein HYY49_04890 [Ignavibacteriales bacterium]|nr:hypothetical protein [Ignavibacteriales bacterium]